MENIFPIAAVLVILLIVLFVYLSRKKVTVSDAEKTPSQENRAEINNDESAIEEDAYAKFMPHVTEVQNEEIVKSKYKKMKFLQF